MSIKVKYGDNSLKTFTQTKRPQSKCPRDIARSTHHTRSDVRRSMCRLHDADIQVTWAEVLWSSLRARIRFREVVHPPWTGLIKVSHRVAWLARPSIWVLHALGSCWRAEMEAAAARDGWASLWTSDW